MANQIPDRLPFSMKLGNFSNTKVQLSSAEILLRFPYHRLFSVLIVLSLKKLDNERETQKKRADQSMLQFYFFSLRMQLQQYLNHILIVAEKIQGLLCTFNCPCK